MYRILGNVYYIFYNFLLIFFSPLILIIFYLKDRGDLNALKQRFGFNNFENTKKYEGKPKIWIHASSVGEFNGITYFIKKLMSKKPEAEIIITTNTISGRKKAFEIFGKLATVSLAPCDTVFSVMKFLRKIGPQYLIITETELWPNLIKFSEIFGCKIFLINGRISDAAFERYKIFKPLMRIILECFVYLFVQNNEYKEKLELLGAPPQKIKITGTTKFDVLVPPVFSLSKTSDKLDARNLTVIFGSLRSKEESIILPLCKKMTKIYEDLKIIIAPRHLERVDTIVDFFKKNQISYALRSRNATTDYIENILIIDTIGELNVFYGKADIAFVGGTLAPYGGHNVLEPAAFGIPVLFGPYIANCRDSANILVENGGGIKVENSEYLSACLFELIENRAKRIEIGRKALMSLKIQGGKSEDLIKMIFQKKNN